MSQVRRQTTTGPGVKTAAPEVNKDRDPRRERRESIESFVVFFLAFLIWSLEAEGFVIPTGSMAPTLMGRHKEVVCPECEYVYTVNADCEIDSSGAGGATGLRVTWGTCENCRAESLIEDVPSVSGDRIYTTKRGLSLPFVPSAGQVGPQRWEVSVFKLPEEPEVRYIKRMVGLPEETVRIHRGDLWRRPLASTGTFERLRRPIAHQQAMQVTVYDDAHRPKSLRDDPRWTRWVSTAESWTEPTRGTYRPAAAADGPSELRYRHVFPDPAQWEAVRAGSPLPGVPRSSLITDFSSYNTDLAGSARDNPRQASRPWFQPHWVGDLTLGLHLDVEKAAGFVTLDLVKGGRIGRCGIDLASGMASLLVDDEPLGEPAATPLGSPGTHDLAFANVDGRLSLLVDGKPIFGDGLVYEADDSGMDAEPTTADLEPARISTRGAAVEISRLILSRDAHYTLEPGEPDLPELETYRRGGTSAFFDLLSNPAGYRALGVPGARDYALGTDRYLMLGDNSPWSRDGRAWGRRDQAHADLPGRGWDDSGRESWEVPGGLIIGKAFGVYWPHAKPVWPRFRLGNDWTLPVRPAFERMRWIR